MIKRKGNYMEVQIKISADAYIFDFDGTLVDSMPMWTGKMLSILEENKIKYPKDIIRTITPLGDKKTAEYFVKQLGVPLSVEEIRKQMDEYALYAYAHTIQAKETAIETIQTLRRKKYKLAILTASPHKMVDDCLKRLGLFDLFDKIWTSEDFNLTKVDPEIYRLAANEIDVPIEKCVLADDSIGALKTAKKAGMKIIGVYDKSAEEYEDEIREISDLYVTRLKDIFF